MKTERSKPELALDVHFESMYGKKCGPESAINLVFSLVEDNGLVITSTTLSLHSLKKALNNWFNNESHL